MSSEADTTSATATVATPTKVAPPSDADPTSAPNTPGKEVDEARAQLVQGRRHLLVKDYFSAVASLAKGCELLAQKFGDTAPELGDAYLTYGRALLELARSESGVLGLNQDGEGEGEEEEDDDEEGEGDGEAGEEEGEEDAAEAKENGAEAKAKNGEDAAEAKEEEEKEGKAVADAEPTAKANGNGTEKEANGVEENGKAEEVVAEVKEEEEEDDVNNLQLAWEVLELAKAIFVKQLEAEGEADLKQTSLKLAEVHLKLGEVGVESENYSTAVEDMKACLELQQRHLDDDDRRVAETLYNMGVAYSLANEFDSAIEQFKLASGQIQKRIASLEKMKVEPVAEEKSSSDDPFYTVQGEISELKALLPEMNEKVSDMQDFKKETIRRMMDGLAEASAKQSSTADGAGPSSAADKPVSSVAHLVKRKPKDEAVQVVEKVEKTEKVNTEVAQEAEKTEKIDAEDLESSLDRKRKPEDSVAPEDTTKKAKVDDLTESKPSE